MKTQNGKQLLLRPSVSGILGLLLISCAFVAIGVFMVRKGEIAGWFVAGFFGLGVIVAVVQLLPGASYLLLTEDGFEVKTMYRSWSATWDDIDFFSTAKFGRNTMVVFWFSRNYDKSKLSRWLAVRIADFEGGLPDTYGMKAEELADLLTECKDSFGNRK